MEKKRIVTQEEIDDLLTGIPSSHEMLGCPFCGKTPFLKKEGRVYILFGPSMGYKVICRNDLCRVTVETNMMKKKEDAIYLWNSRESLCKEVGYD